VKIRGIACGVSTAQPAPHHDHRGCPVGCACAPQL